LIQGLSNINDFIISHNRKTNTKYNMADDVLNSLLSGELNHMQVIDALSSSSSIVVRDTMFT